VEKLLELVINGLISNPSLVEDEKFLLEANELSLVVRIANGDLRDEILSLMEESPIAGFFIASRFITADDEFLERTNVIYEDLQDDLKAVVLPYILYLTRMRILFERYQEISNQRATQNLRASMGQVIAPSVVPTIGGFPFGKR